MPKGIIGAMLFLLLTAVIVVVLCAGAAATDQSTMPLVDALNACGSNNLAVVVNVLALAGLVAPL